jgi:tripartite-type tricarboxylate transporter receptor subunit TctC
MPGRGHKDPPSRRARGWQLAAALIAAMPGLPAAAGSGTCAELDGATLRWIVPNSPGGGYDTYSRLLQPFLAKQLGATIVIENQPAAGGLVAAAAIRDAAPDGRTVGLINAAGLLAARLDGSTVNPATDFTVLARILRNRIVLLTGRQSGIDNLDQLLRVAERRPVVIGVRDAGSASIVAIPVIAELLGIEYELVTGYVGNSARVLAVARGEVDLIVQNLDSNRQFIQDGTVRPVLQVTGALASDDARGRDPMLAGVPVLGGETGIAQQRARLQGRSVEQALKRADSLAGLVDAGRLIVAPAALPAPIRDCLEAAVGAVLRSPGLQSAADRAGLGIEPTGAADARADIRTAAAALEAFAPLVRETMQRARQ